MRNKKAIFAGALMVPALALTGGIAYASTTGSPAAVRTAVTSTVQPNSQHTTGQARHDRCDWRYGDHRCDWRGHGYHRQANHRQATYRHGTRHHAYQHRGYRNHHGDQGRSGYGYGGYGHGGYQGNWGYQGGYSGNHCGDGCGW